MAKQTVNRRPHFPKNFLSNAQNNNKRGRSTKAVPSSVNPYGYHTRSSTNVASISVP